MRRFVFVLLGMLIIIVGSISMYIYLNPSPPADLHNEMFVDRGEDYGYATMYYLSEAL